jgi:hypothetical protein
MTHSMKIQSIAFPKTWKRSQVTVWLKKHNFFPIKGEHDTANFKRFRILPPRHNANYATKILPNNVHLTLMRV